MLITHHLSSNNSKIAPIATSNAYRSTMPTRPHITTTSSHTAVTNLKICAKWTICIWSHRRCTMSDIWIVPFIIPGCFCIVMHIISAITIGGYSTWNCGRWRWRAILTSSSRACRVSPIFLYISMTNIRRSVFVALYIIIYLYTGLYIYICTYILIYIDIYVHIYV